MNDERVDYYAEYFAVTTTKEQRDLLWEMADKAGERREAELGLFRSTNPDRMRRTT